jgi:hypothetical protein
VGCLLYFALDLLLLDRFEYFDHAVVAAVGVDPLENLSVGQGCGWAVKGAKHVPGQGRVGASDRFVQARAGEGRRKRGSERAIISN